MQEKGIWTEGQKLWFYSQLQLNSFKTLCMKLNLGYLVSLCIKEVFFDFMVLRIQIILIQSTPKKNLEGVSSLVKLYLIFEES